MEVGNLSAVSNCVPDHALFSESDRVPELGKCDAGTGGPAPR